ncbi:hypothetical protein [Streptomyces gobiensis]|uniref:hypothetical protein n=1 Tax=Streptomyces gobiensis TaxID=2875706 RepID=UPI001E549803|nr:hypothetical protein [Streptomyces gobiensis]UGY92682.1 hypothetical protein test1122_13765 [Streptomyces gobiensis]
MGGKSGMSGVSGMGGTPWSRGRILPGPGRGPRLLFGRMYEDPRVELAVPPAVTRRVTVTIKGYGAFGVPFTRPTAGGEPALGRWPACLA